jgi:hypothetical protein
MIDERKIEIVAKNFSADSWDKYEKTLEKIKNFKALYK